MQGILDPKITVILVNKRQKVSVVESCFQDGPQRKPPPVIHTLV